MPDRLGRVGEEARRFHPATLAEDREAIVLFFLQATDFLPVMVVATPKRQAIQVASAATNDMAMCA